METAANKAGSIVRYPRAQSKHPHDDFTSDASVVADHVHALPTTTVRNAMLTNARQYNCTRGSADLSVECASSLPRLHIAIVANSGKSLKHLLSHMCFMIFEPHCVPRCIVQSSPLQLVIALLQTLRGETRGSETERACSIKLELAPDRPVRC